MTGMNVHASRHVRARAPADGETQATSARDRALVVCAHPDLAASGFSRPFLEALDESCFAKKALAETYPDWRFDVAREQADLVAAAEIVLLFPVFWYSPPALLQKWLEDVLVDSDGFEQRASLAGKPARMIVSTGGSADEYGPAGKNGHSVEDFLRSLETTLRYVGCVVGPSEVHHAAWRYSEEEVRALAGRFAAERRR